LTKKHFSENSLTAYFQAKLILYIIWGLAPQQQKKIWSILQKTITNIPNARPLVPENNIRYIYASSAATYGAGEMGYDDDEKLIQKLNL